MKFFSKLNKFEQNKTPETITEIKCCGVGQSKLAEVMTINLYTRIIHKCFARTIIPDGIDRGKFKLSIYDSYSPFKRGLASIIVFALTTKRQIYVRVEESNRGVKLFTVLDSSASEQEKNASNVIELDFRNFRQVDLVRLMFDLVTAILSAVDKGVSISQAMVFKLHKLSEMIQNSANDEVLRQQITQLNDSITQGNAGFIDGQSDIIFPVYDSTPAEKSIELVYGLIANITGLPTSFIFGETVGGLGSTSDSDNQRLNDAIEYYYYNVVNNILYSVYNKEFEFKQYVDDINELVSMFTFIETTDLLTAEGKRKFMLNNTGFIEEDINITEPANQSNAPITNNNDNAGVDIDTAEQ